MRHFIAYSRLQRATLAAALTFMFAVAGAGQAHAAGSAAPPDVITLPSGLNLGLSSFYDGFTPVQPGTVALVDYFKFEHLDEITNQSGHASSVFNNPRINAEINVLQAIWVSPVQFAGGVLGFTVLEPIVNIDSHFDGPGVILHNNGLGFGDTIFGPYFQSLPVISGGRPVFSYRLEFDTIAPTGAFDSRRDLNQGSGFWSIIPYFAFTALPTPELEISARIHYLYNFETSRAANPPPIPGFEFVNGQAGQATWINFASSYAVAPWVSVGVNGFYLKQLTNDTVNGISLPGTKKEELYLGPGMHFPFDGTNANILNVNAYFPVETKGVAQGPQITAQFIHVF